MVQFFFPVAGLWIKRQRKPSTGGASSGACFLGPAQEVPLSTVKMTITALKVFHRWMVNEFNDNRPIQQIQPQELDPILAKFFSSVLTQDQREYSAKSLKAFREGLERHLKKAGYPFSITTCREFSVSQQAYKVKFNFLRNQKVDAKNTDPPVTISKS